MIHYCLHNSTLHPFKIHQRQLVDYSFQPSFQAEINDPPNFRWWDSTVWAAVNRSETTIHQLPLVVFAKPSAATSSLFRLAVARS